jgi:hypothetical protein
MTAPAADRRSPARWPPPTTAPDGRAVIARLESVDRRLADRIGGIRVFSSRWFFLDVKKVYICDRYVVNDPTFQDRIFSHHLAISLPTVVIDGVLYELDPSMDIAVAIDTVDPDFQFQASIRCCHRVWSVRRLAAEHVPLSCHEIMVSDGIELIDPNDLSFLQRPARSLRLPVLGRSLPRDPGNGRADWSRCIRILQVLDEAQFSNSRKIERN